MFNNFGFLFQKLLGKYTSTEMDFIRISISEMGQNATL
jgi:hypothetical protein